MTRSNLTRQCNRHVAPRKAGSVHSNDDEQHIVQSMPSGSNPLHVISSAGRAFSCLTHNWRTCTNNALRSVELVYPTAVTNNAGATPALSDGFSPPALLSIGPAQWPAAQPANSRHELVYTLQRNLHKRTQTRAITSS